MQRTSCLSLVFLAAALAHAGPILNGDFGTGSLPPWVGQVSPDSGPYTPPAPHLATGSGSGINAPSGLGSDPYAVIDTTLAAGNPAGVDVWGSISQTATFGGVTGLLEFRLTDFGDEPPPVISNNHAALLLDNIGITSDGVNDTLSFDWYALAKANQSRNDRWDLLFAGDVLFSFWYNDPLLPTTESGGGGGTQFGPFSYGTGWQHTQITRPVPEPATWALLLCGALPLVRRRTWSV